MKTPPPAPARRTVKPAESASASGAQGKWLLVTFFVLAVGGMGFAWWEHTQLQTLAAASAAKAAPAPVVSTRKPEPPPVAPGELPPIPPEEPPPPDPTTQRQQEVAAFSQLLNNPLVQKITDNLARGAVDKAYANLFNQLTLTPEQDTTMRDLLAQRMTSSRDALTTAVAQGIDPRANPDQFQAILNQTQAPIDQNIRSTLNDTASYQAYQTYQATVDENWRRSQQQRQGQ